MAFIPISPPLFKVLTVRYVPPLPKTYSIAAGQGTRTAVPATGQIWPRPRR